jgi:hypothetical protein
MTKMQGDFANRWGRIANPTESHDGLIKSCTTVTTCLKTEDFKRAICFMKMDCSSDAIVSTLILL